MPDTNDKPQNPGVLEEDFLTPEQRQQLIDAITEALSKPSTYLRKVTKLK